MKINKLFLVFVLIVAVFAMCFTNVYATEVEEDLTISDSTNQEIAEVMGTEYEENLIKRVAPDGKNATFKAAKPVNPEFSDYYITNIVAKMINDTEYSSYAYCENGDLSKCRICIYKEDGSFEKFYEVNLTWDEPVANKVLTNLDKTWEKCNWDEPEKFFKLTDLGLINYYMTSSKSELWNVGAPSRALKYSEDIISLTNGGNIVFEMTAGMGDQGDDLLFESAFGETTAFYNGYAYTSREQGIYFSRVIYIPQDTKDTKEAYIAAAQKRINDYIGNDKDVKVEFGDVIDENEVALNKLVDISNTDGNYYNITVKGKTYKFHIIKSDVANLTKPTYLGSDLKTDIKITSDASEVPLDTALKVEKVVSNELKSVVGNENYQAFDIKLYSDGKAGAVKELANGEFEVSIPVPAALASIKNLTVYYLNNGKLDDYNAEITKEGYAVFKTNHFSTYVIAEKTGGTSGVGTDTPASQDKPIKDKTPATGTMNITNYVLGIIVLAGVGIVFVNKIENKQD